MNRREFLFSGISAGLGVGTRNFSSLDYLLISSQDKRVKVLADNDRFSLKAYSDGFRRGDLIVIEVEPKKTLEDLILRYNVITNRNTPRRFILPKLEKNGKIYALAGINVDYPKQVTTLGVELIANGKNIGNGDLFSIYILDRKFEAEYFVSSDIENASPNSREDILSHQREVKILYPSWNDITKRSYIDEGFIYPRPECNPDSFGSRRFYDSIERSSHKGIDCEGSVGDLIFASMSGIVKLVEQDFFYMGNTIVLDHGLGLYTLYAHMSEQLVKRNQYVKVGNPIGKVGKTGRTRGAHLHWQAKLYGGRREAMNMNPMSLEILNQVFH